MSSSSNVESERSIGNLYENLLRSEFVSSLVNFNWSEVRYKQIIITSILINLLELAAPLYINIVYTVIIPAKSDESLVTLAAIVIIMVVAAGILKNVRLYILGQDSARFEHTKRLSLIRHFVSIPVSKFLETSPSVSFARLNSINLLRDEGALQFISTSIDIVFSVIFIFFLFILGGPFLALPVIIAIIYYIRNGYARLDYYKILSRERDTLEIENMNYQTSIIESVELIKSNGLSRKFISEEEMIREKINSRKVIESNYISSFQSFGRFVNQSTYALVITIGAILIMNDRMMIGALTASILLVGKIIGPWQQAISLLKSYLRLDFARDEYNEIFNIDTNMSAIGNQSFTNIFDSDSFSVQVKDFKELIFHTKQSSLLRDQSKGQIARRIFMNIMQIETNLNVQLNSIDVGMFSKSEIISNLSYVNPAYDFFEDSLMQNITSFQQSKFKKSALFWSYYLGLDERVKLLVDGYNTIVGSTKNNGLSRDDILLLHIIRGLVIKPTLLIIDLLDCSFGKSFIDGLEVVLTKCNGNTTIILLGNGAVLEKLSSNLVLIN